MNFKKRKGSEDEEIISFLLFIISTACLVCIIDPTPFERKSKTPKTQQLTEGFRIIWQYPSFRTIHVMMIFESVAGVVWVAAVMYLFVADVLHVLETWWGYINATFFIGLLIGGAICIRFERIFEKNFKNIVLGASLGVAITMLAFGFNRIALLALLFSCLFGIFEQIKGILLSTWLQLKATDEQLIKVYSAQGVLNSLLFGLSTLLAGTFATIFSVQWLFIGAGILLFGSAIYFSAMKKRFL